MTIKVVQLTPEGNGGVAQLGEHLPCKQGVMGSIPIISTSGKLPQPETTSGNEMEAKELRVRKGLIAQPVRAHA